MFQLITDAGSLIDIIQKMGVPTTGGKVSYAFPIIAPKFTPAGGLEWYGKLKALTVRVKCKKLNVSGITQDIRIPINITNFLSALSMFKTTDQIVWVHDEDHGIERITGGDPAEKTMLAEVGSAEVASVAGACDEFPGSLDTDGVILLRGGTIRPNIHATCNVSIFRTLIENTHIVTGTKKTDEVPAVYHMKFDETTGTIETIAGKESSRTKRVIRNVLGNVTGDGECFYALGFADIMTILDGPIDVYCVPNGPMWVSQQTESKIVQYLIPPVSTAA